VSELIAPSQTAEETGLSEHTLAIYRCRGNGPPYYKIGKFVRYDREEVRQWMRSRRYRSTSDER
jgi:predicted DNA-binding transcriptional regulator AlpA